MKLTKKEIKTTSEILEAFIIRYEIPEDFFKNNFKEVLRLAFDWANDRLSKIQVKYLVNKEFKEALRTYYYKKLKSN